MRLNQLKAFLAIVDAGSIRGAARQLNVTQPAVTKGLRQLEEELHVRLLERTQLGVVPTLAGRAFIARARTIQSELRKADEELAQLAGERAGSVSFGVSLVALQIVPEAFSRFRAEFPDARVRMVEAVSHLLLRQIRDETLDFAVGRWVGGKPEAWVSLRPLFRTEMVVAGRDGHPLAAMKSLKQLANADWVTVIPPGISGSVIEQAFTLAGLPSPTSITYCESFAALIGLVAGTDLLVMLPRVLVSSPIASVGLQTFSIRDTLPRQGIALMTRADARLTPVAAAMAKAITTAARRLARQS